MMNILITGNHKQFLTRLTEINLFSFVICYPLGTSRGIGLGLTNQFLQKTNAKVVATCRNPEDASELQELSQRYRERLVILPLDITRPDSFIQLHRTLPDFGVHSIDILIGNAAISNRDHPNDPILSCNPEEVMQLFQTNVVGNLILLQTFHSMVAQSTLKIAAIISSSQGSIEHAVSSGQSDPTGYRLSKVALNMMSVLYAVQPQVRDAGVKVLIIHPGKLFLCFSPRMIDDYYFV